MGISIHPSTCFDSLRPIAASVPPPSFEPPRPELFRIPAPTAIKVLAVAATALAALGTFGSRNESAPNQRAVAAPSLKHAETGDATRWHRDHVEVTLDPSLQELGPDGLDAVRQSFGAWIETDAALPSVQFNTAKNSTSKAKQDGVNRVLAAPITIPGHENDLAITVSYVGASGEILEADIIVNTNVEYHADEQQPCNKQYDLRNVVTHEAGHFLGLGEDAVDADGTMYFKTSRCETKKRTLSQPDVVTVASLYEGALTENDLEPGVSCSAAAGPSRSNLAWLFGAFAAVVVALRRRGQPERAE